ncbi:MAG: LUD domain-containing protein [Taibaiella sp.]|jgi:L-lactate dehydrogenase complex protein LldG
MSSRESILSATETNQPDLIPLNVPPQFALWFDDPLSKFKEVLTAIGGQVFEITSLSETHALIQRFFPDAGRIISDIEELQTFTETTTMVTDPHTLEDVDIAILKGKFGVAENGAVWITEKEIAQRALPFICQRLILILSPKDIVPLMHDAYHLIATDNYNYGTFIAGPSKTADIEQSLVLGAHGPVSMGVILVG